jgi:hypothetical protein
MPILIDDENIEELTLRVKEKRSDSGFDGY